MFRLLRRGKGKPGYCVALSVRRPCACTSVRVVIGVATSPSNHLGGNQGLAGSGVYRYRISFGVIHRVGVG